MSAGELSDPRPAGRMVLKLCPKTSPGVGEGVQLWAILLQRAQQIPALGQIWAAEKS